MKRISEKKQNKDKRLDFRITEDFFRDFDEKVKSSGLKRPAFFAQIFYQSRVIIKKDYNLLGQQVRKVGVNLNEIAYVLNVANLKHILNSYDYQVLLIELKLIENQLQRIGA